MKRVQRKRTKGWRMPENTIYVGRGSEWGNPFTIGKIYYASNMIEAAMIANGDKSLLDKLLKGNGLLIKDRELSLKLFRNLALCFERKKYAPLAGKNLACWCSLSDPCHADILLKLADKKYKRNRI